MKDHLKTTGDRRMNGESPWDTCEFTSKRIFNNPRLREEGIGHPRPQ